MGSSLVVQPFASLKDRLLIHAFFSVCLISKLIGHKVLNLFIFAIQYRVREDCPRLLINRELVGQNELLRALGLSSGLDFDPTSGARDVFWEGLCDDGCQLLSDKLGWGVSTVD